MYGAVRILGRGDGEALDRVATRLTSGCGHLGDSKGDNGVEERASELLGVYSALYGGTSGYPESSAISNGGAAPVLDKEKEDAEGRRESLASYDSISVSKGCFRKFIIDRFSSGNRNSGGKEFRSKSKPEKSRASSASFFPSQPSIWLMNIFQH